MDGINFIVLGAGAWGTAMSIHLAKLNHSVVLVPRDENKAEKIVPQAAQARRDKIKV